MPIIINRPSYNQQAIQQPLRDENDLGRFGEALKDTISTLGTIVTQSSAEASKSTAEKELSQLNLETSIKLGELQRSGATDIEKQIEQFQTEKIADIESRNANVPFFKKMFNDNVWRVKDNLSLKAKEAQLNSDALLDANNRQVAIQTNLANIQLDSNNFQDSVQSTFDLVNNSNSMTLKERLDTKNNFYQQASKLAIENDISRYGTDAVIKRLKEGEYNVVEDVNGEEVHHQSYSNGVPSIDALNAIITAKSQDFDQTLAYGSLEQLKSLRDNWTKVYGQNNHGYNVNGIGKVWDVKTKAANYAKLEKAIKSKAIKAEDLIKQQEQELMLRGLQGDQKAIQTMQELKDNGGKTFNNVLAHIQTFQPVAARTNDDIFSELTTKIQELSDIDTSLPATDNAPSGIVQAMQKKVEIVQELQNLNKNRNLSEEDLATYQKLVMGYNDADWETINTAIPNIKEFKLYARTQEGKAFMSVTPDASIYRSRSKTVKALATAASKQLVQSVINHAPVQEIQGTIDRYKKAIILTSFPELKVNGKEGPEVVKPGTDIIINGNTWTFKGFEADGLTPVIARRIKR